MRNRGSKSLGIALVMVSVLAPGAIAAPRYKPAPNPLRGQPFTVSGSFSGALQGDVRLDGVEYRFDPDARIRLLRAFHRLVDEEQPYTFFLSRKKVYCAWNDVKNVIYSKDWPIENSFPWWVASAP